MSSKKTSSPNAEIDARQVYKYWLRTFGSSKLWWVGAFLSLCASVVSQLGNTLMLAQVTDDITSASYDQAQRSLVYLLGINIVNVLLSFASNTLCCRQENKTYVSIGRDYYQSITNKDMSFYASNKTGVLTASFRQFVNGYMGLTKMLRGEGLRLAVSFVVVIFTFGFISPGLGLLALAISVAQVLYIRWSSRKVNVHRSAAHSIYREVTGLVSDKITNISAFKSKGGDHDDGELTSLTQREEQVFWRRRLADEMYNIPRSLISVMAIVLSLYLVIGQARSGGGLDSGMLVVLALFLFRMNRNTERLPGMITDHEDKMTMIIPNLQLLQEAATVVDKPDAKDIDISSAKINIDDVSFGYGDGEGSTAIDNLSLEIPGGSSIGVVGHSGAGKSTLAELLVRFYDVDGGVIKIDGQDISKVKQGSLRSKIGYVPQEPLLFHKSIRDNIAYFNPRATDAQITRAAKVAHADEFIKDLPDGYGSVVGERGMKLSGGQKQRVVIARTVLKKAPIMIFDEATSALDSESERIIQKALPEVIEGATAIVIAHRLSTVKNLDKIIVIKAGKIVESGTHAQLIKRGGVYAQMWDKQTDS